MQQLEQELRRRGQIEEPLGVFCETVDEQAAFRIGVTCSARAPRRPAASWFELRNQAAKVRVTRRAFGEGHDRSVAVAVRRRGELRAGDRSYSVVTARRMKRHLSGEASGVGERDPRQPQLRRTCGIFSRRADGEAERVIPLNVQRQDRLPHFVSRTKPSECRRAHHERQKNRRLTTYPSGER